MREEEKVMLRELLLWCVYTLMASFFVTLYAANSPLICNLKDYGAPAVIGFGAAFLITILNDDVQKGLAHWSRWKVFVNSVAALFISTWTFLPSAFIGSALTSILYVQMGWFDEWRQCPILVDREWFEQARGAMDLIENPDDPLGILPKDE